MSIAQVSNDNCVGALPIEIDTSYILDFTHASLSQSEACDGIFLHQVDLWFSFIGTGKLIEFDDGSSFSRVLSQFFIGSCPELICVEDIILNSGNVAIYSEVGVRYLVRALWSSNPFNPAIRLKEVDVVDNSYCEGAIYSSDLDSIKVSLSGTVQTSIPCSAYSGTLSSLWFIIDGVGRLQQFQAHREPLEFNLYSGSCDDLQCLPRTVSGRYHNRTHTFKTELGQQYYLSINSHRGNLHEDTTLVVGNIQEINPYDSVQTAMDLLCGEEITVSLHGATSDIILNNKFQPSIWVKIVGKGKYHSFDFRHINNYVDLGFYRRNGSRVQETFFGTYNYLANDSVYYLNIVGDHDAVFAISMDCHSIPINDVCTGALPIDISAPIVASNTFSRVDTVFNCGVTNYRAFDVWYEIIGDDGLYTIQLDNHGHARDLEIYQGSCAELQCPFYYKSYGDSSTRVTLQIQADEKYYIRIYNIAGQTFDTASFTLLFEETQISSNDLCANATLLNCGLELVDSNLKATLDTETCHLMSNEYPGNWYKFLGTGANLVMEFLDISTNDIRESIGISIFNGGCHNLECIYESARFFQKRMLLETQLNEEYYILISRAPTYRFRVSCAELVDNNNYQNAIPIHCGDTVSGYVRSLDFQAHTVCRWPETSPDFWFSIIGTDNFVYINEDLGNASVRGIYTEMNGILHCVGSFRHRRYFLEEGVKYLLRFIQFEDRAPTFAAFDFTISLDCQARHARDFCRDAMLLSPGDRITLFNQHASDESDDLDCVGGDLRRGIWYRVDGDNRFWRLSFQNPQFPGIYFRPDIKIYHGECESLSCDYSAVTNTLDKAVFYAEEGQNYYINIGGDLDTLIMKVSTHEQEENDFCHNAYSINVGDTLRANFNYAKACDYADLCRFNISEKRLWYKFLGQGRLERFSLGVNAHNSHYEIIVNRGSCCELFPIRNGYGSKKNTTFFAEEGVVYYVAAQLRAVNDDGQMWITRDTLSQTSFSLCENAFFLENNSLYSISTEETWNSLLVDNIHFDSRVLWFEFFGSGSLDIIEIDAPGSNSYGFDLRIYLDQLRDCNSLVDSELNYYDKTNTFSKCTLAISTIRDSLYKLAVEVRPEKYHQILINKRVEEPENRCEISGAGVYYFSQEQNIPVDFTIAGSDKPFFVRVQEEHTGASNHDWRNGDDFHYEPTRSVSTVLQFINEDCHGHIPIRFISAMATPLICPDSILPCARQIFHRDLTLPSFHHRARQLIRSSAQVQHGANLIYSSGNRVVLRNDFTVPKGASFEIRMQDCGGQPGDDEEHE